MSLTTMLVMYTLFSQVSNDLPDTAYIKMLDAWFFFCIFLILSIIFLHVTVEHLPEGNASKSSSSSPSPPPPPQPRSRDSTHFATSVIKVRPHVLSSVSPPSSSPPMSCQAKYGVTFPFSSFLYRAYSSSSYYCSLFWLFTIVFSTPFLFFPLFFFFFTYWSSFSPFSFFIIRLCIYSSSLSPFPSFLRLNFTPDDYSRLFITIFPSSLFPHRPCFIFFFFVIVFLFSLLSVSI